MPPLRSVLIALALFIAPALARAQFTPVTSPETPAEAAFGAKVRAYLLRHPEVLAEVLERLQAQQDAAKAAAATAIIAARRQAIAHDPRDPVLGNPSGKVSVVEFFDYRCPYCRAFEPTLEALLATNPDVRLVLKEFPILDVEDQTHISQDAARAALAANAQGRFGPVHRALFARKALDEAGIVEVLKANGVDLSKAKAAETTPATTAQLTDVHALAQDLGIDGTPAFVVGDRMISGADADALRAAIVEARKTAAVAAKR